MDTENTNDGKAMPPASAGSHGLPVAWAVMQPDSYSVFASRALAEKMRELCDGGDIVPLYRAPTLTDEERDEIEGMISDYQDIAEFNDERCHPHYAEKARRRAAMLIGLLERLG